MDVKWILYSDQPSTARYANESLKVHAWRWLAGLEVRLTEEFRTTSEHIERCNSMQVHDENRRTNRCDLLLLLAANCERMRLTSVYGLGFGGTVRGRESHASVEQPTGRNTGRQRNHRDLFSTLWGPVPQLGHVMHHLRVGHQKVQ